MNAPSLIPVVALSEFELNTRFENARSHIEPIMEEFKLEVDRLDGSSIENDKFMEMLYKYVDKVMEHISPLSVCQSGCSNCCKLNVSVSIMEAEYIESKTGHKYNRKAREFTQQRRGENSGKLLSNCPFLNVNTRTCSIYEYRPLSCRMFLTFDSADHCKTVNSTHKIFSTESSPAFTQVLISLLKSVNKQQRLRFNISEIRELFKKVKQK
jgi:Fe-S-cluster containining protein